MRIGYLRVSTVEQNLERQREALERYSIERWYEEKVSGKDTAREQLQAMLSYAREGDTIYVHDFSRLARSTKDLLSIVEDLRNRGIGLVSVKENIDSSTSSGKLMLTMIAAINEFERTNMLERQREGIEIAKRNGVYKGRKPVTLPDDFEEYYGKWQRHEMSKAKIALALGVSRPTCNRLFEMYESRNVDVVGV